MAHGAVLPSTYEIALPLAGDDQHSKLGQGGHHCECRLRFGNHFAYSSGVQRIDQQRQRTVVIVLVKTGTTGVLASRTVCALSAAAAGVWLGHGHRS